MRIALGMASLLCLASTLSGAAEKPAAPAFSRDAWQWQTVQMLKGFAAIAKAGSLQSLSLPDTTLNDRYLQQLTSLTNLTYMGAHGTQVTVKGAREFGLVNTNTFIHRFAGQKGKYDEPPQPGDAGGQR